MESNCGNDLIESYKAGDQEAFCELYEWLAPKLRAFIVKRVRETGLAKSHSRLVRDSEEIFMKAWCSLYVHYKHFEIGRECSVTKFAIQQCKFRCLQYRDESRQDWRLDSLDDAATEKRGAGLDGKRSSCDIERDIVIRDVIGYCKRTRLDFL